MTPQQIEHIMDLYRRFERQGPAPAGYRIDVHEGVVRHIAPGRQGHFISDYAISDKDLDAVIAKEVAFFDNQGMAFEWKVYDTDRPKRIGAALTAQGFVRGEAEAFMVLDLEKAPASLFAPTDLVVTQVSGAQGVADMASVQNQAFGFDSDFDTANQEAILTALTHEPDNHSLYVIYQDGIPVSTARQTFLPNSPFSGLWGGSTLPAYRGKGCYTALLHRRALDAKQRGIQYLTIDASDMSRPIVEKVGFEWVTTTYPYEFKGSELQMLDSRF